MTDRMWIIAHWLFALMLAVVTAARVYRQEFGDAALTSAFVFVLLFLIWADRRFDRRKAEMERQKAELDALRDEIDKLTEDSP